MNYAYPRANGNRRLIGFEEGVMVLSRYPLVFTESAELQPRAGFFEHRVALHAIARTHLGLLDLYVTHLTNGTERINREQVGSLFEYVTDTARHTALVTGDFNAQEGSPQISSLSRTWLDAYRASSPLDPGFTCCIDDLHVRAGILLTKRIDYIFLVPDVREGFNVSEASVVFDQPRQFGDGWLWASDHAGVLVTIEPTP